MIQSRIFTLPVVAAAIFALYLLHDPVKTRAQSKEPASSAQAQQQPPQNKARIPCEGRAELKPTPVTIHGPFVSSVSAIKETVPLIKKETAPRVTVFSEQHRFGIGVDAARGLPPPEIPLSAHGPGQKTSATPQPKLPNANPVVVSGFDVIDPQIAVGTNDVVVTLRQQILLFHKADLIGQPAGANVTPAKVIPLAPQAGVSTSAFFPQSLTDDINSHLLNQPANYDVAHGYGINPAYDSNDTYYDARAVYDSYRNRFWVIALAVTDKASPTINPAACTDPVAQSARRSKIVVAVSQGDDAFGTWYYYWWDGNQDEDTDPRIISQAFFSHVDYPLLGISEKYVLVENRADICHVDNKVCSDQKYCQPPDGQQENYDYVTVAPAEALVMGSLPQFKTAAVGFKNFKYPNGTVIPPAHSIAPAVHDGSVPNGRSFLANPYVDMNGKSWLMIWYMDTVGSLTGPYPTFYNFTVPIRPLSQLPLTMGSLAAPTAAFRGQELTVAFGEQVTCNSSTIFAIRVIRVNVVTQKVVFDQTHGRRDPHDPPNIDCVNYGQPAIQVNKNGDTVFVYQRRAQGTVPTEARYAVIYPLAPPSAALLQGGTTYSHPVSVLLQGGTTDVGLGYDNSGISLDPDDQAIWFVTVYGAGTPAIHVPQIAIGRIWGK
jgi:hypothetical protein